MFKFNKMVQLVGLGLLPLLYLEKLALPFPILSSTYHVLRVVSFFLLPVLGYGLVAKKIKPTPGFPEIALLIYLLSQTISASFSNLPRETLGPLSHLYIAVLAYFLFAHAASVSKRFAQNSIFVICILMIITGITSFSALISSSLIESVWKNVLWGNVFKAFLFDFGRGRIRPIGAVFVTSFLPLYYVLATGRSVSRKKQFFGKLSLISGFIAIILMNYRNYILNYILSIIIIFFILGKNKKYKHRNLFPALFILSIALGLFITFLQLFTPVKIVERFYLYKNDFRESAAARIQFIKDAAGIASKNLIFGTGTGTYEYFSDPIKIGITFQRISLHQFSAEQYIGLGPHNIVLQSLAETGIIGLMASFAVVAAFAVEDCKKMAGKDILTIVLLSSFWLFILGSLVDAFPPYSFSTALAVRGIAKGYFDSFVKQDKK